MQNDPTIPAGMKPWHGGERAPDDWDGGPVLLRDRTTWGKSLHGASWKHIIASSLRDIIAYTPRPTPAEIEPVADETRAREVLDRARRRLTFGPHNTGTVPYGVAIAAMLAFARDPSTLDDQGDIATIAYMMGAKDERDRKIATPPTQPAGRDAVCTHCGGNGYSGGVVPAVPDHGDACEVCLGSGKLSDRQVLMEAVERNWNAGPDALVNAILALTPPAPERALREALKPFADLAQGEVWERFIADSKMNLCISNGSGSAHYCFVNAECFEAARSALARGEKA